ncbi:MAG: DUF2828 family protein [Betaproteobacteria bacterium]|nr:DUF2828 family protein [Betaproteobacteria bacterium]
MASTSNDARIAVTSSSLKASQSLPISPLPVNSVSSERRFFPSSSGLTPTSPSRMVGAKGSDVYDTSGSKLVDLNVMSVRGADSVKLASIFNALIASDAMEDAFVLLFHIRNVRGGKGERDIFKSLFIESLKTRPAVARALVDLIPHYGCWDDIFTMASSYPEHTELFLQSAVKQLHKDQHDLASSPTAKLSLVSKWAPREGNPLAFKLATMIFPDMPTKTPANKMSLMCAYRKVIASLNKHLKTVETLMCADKWSEVKPGAVPGRADKKYRRAFLNLPSTFQKGRLVGPTELRRLPAMRCPDDAGRMKCHDNFEAYYAKAAAGKAKINGAKTVYPHEVIRDLFSATSGEEKDYYRGLWNSYVTETKKLGGLGRSIMMSDFSGSMAGTPYEVSMALGILGSQVCSEDFQDMLMTFDSTPTWHRFAKDSDIFERVQSIGESGCGHGLSTDFQKAMDLILQTLKEKRVRPGQEPENLIVLTDMAFDQACGSSETSYHTGNRYRHAVKTAPWQTHVELIKEAFTRAGEDMWGAGNGWVAPRIVLWNLRAGSSDFHATADTPGVAMFSGWSPSQFKTLQKDGPTRQATPYDMLRLELNDPMYQRVRDAVYDALLAIRYLDDRGELRYCKAVPFPPPSEVRRRPRGLSRRQRRAPLLQGCAIPSTVLKSDDALAGYLDDRGELRYCKPDYSRCAICSRLCVDFEADLDDRERRKLEGKPDSFRCASCKRMCDDFRVAADTPGALRAIPPTAPKSDNDTIKEYEKLNDRERRKLEGKPDDFRCTCGFLCDGGTGYGAFCGGSVCIVSWSNKRLARRFG